MQTKEDDKYLHEAREVTVEISASIFQANLIVVPRRFVFDRQN